MDFAQPSNGPAKLYCSKKCYDVAYYKANKQKKDTQAVTWVVDNPEGRFATAIKYRFNLSAERYYQILAEQGGGCGICGASNPLRWPEDRWVARTKPQRWHIDHDHECCPVNGKSCGNCIRGLLCIWCNVRLATVEDIEWMTKASQYLGRFK